MIRGFYIYKCKDCGKTFWDADIEKNCTADSMPVYCPECNSSNTKICLFKTLKALLKGEYGGKTR
ncbi:MAG: zinc ribbon domain-containing protein [Bacteroidales bacterium]|nr:zinc ribbon domain-containing protein [Candidatus Sodaliphilus aphodohippi]